MHKIDPQKIGVREINVNVQNRLFRNNISNIYVCFAISIVLLDMDQKDFNIIQTVLLNHQH